MNELQSKIKAFYAAINGVMTYAIIMPDWLFRLVFYKGVRKLKDAHQNINALIRRKVGYSFWHRFTSMYKGTFSLS